jgi:hypothetical protein
MAYLDHDLGPDSTRGPDRPVQRTQTSSPVLDLQRLAGNAAVSQAMQSGRFGSSVTVQRQEEEDEAEKETEEEAGGGGAGGEEMAEVEEEEKAEG